MAARQRGELSALGRYVVAWLERQHMSQRDLALEAGIEESSLTNWKWGRYRPDPEALMLLAAAMHVPYEELEVLVYPSVQRSRPVHASGEGSLVRRTVQEAADSYASTLEQSTFTPEQKEHLARMAADWLKRMEQMKELLTDQPAPDRQQAG